MAQPRMRLPGAARVLTGIGFLVGAVITLAGLYRRGTIALEVYQSDVLVVPGLVLVILSLSVTLVGLSRSRKAQSTLAQVAS
jgi:hypothetical protein